MIRFACPTCQKILKAPDNGVGRKTRCPRCGQRLRVPPPAQPLKETMMGQFLPGPATPPAPPTDLAPGWLADVEQAEKLALPSPPQAPADLSDRSVLLGLVKDPEPDGPPPPAPSCAPTQPRPNACTFGGPDDAVAEGAPSPEGRGRQAMGCLALGGCPGLAAVFDAIAAGAFLLPAKWSPKHYLPLQLSGEPAKARDVAERLQAKGLKCCWVPHGSGRVALCVGLEDTPVNSSWLVTVHLGCGGAAGGRSLP